MSAFSYQDGVLHADKVALPEIAEAAGTPVYIYSQTALEEAFRAFADALDGLTATICYAVKANSNLAVIRTFGALGAGADVVSEGEIRRALAAGIDPDKIVFSGVGKTRDELKFALESAVGQINVESIPEFEALAEVCRETGRSTRVALRVNPDVDAITHEKITTGRKEDKFGIDIDLARELYRQGAGELGLNMAGVAVHIGSQLTQLDPFRAAYGRVAELVEALRADGHRVETLDLGGGLGIVYDSENPPNLAEYGAIVRETLGHLDVELLFEPGRVLTGNAGVLLTRVIYIKPAVTKKFAIVDAAMNDLIRPTLYDAWHRVMPVVEGGTVDADGRPTDLVGPVCETGDILALGRDLSGAQPDDLLAIASAGAYASAMASEYNTRPLIAEVMVRGRDFAIIRERETYDTILARDVAPPWQEAGGPAKRSATGGTGR